MGSFPAFGICARNISKCTKTRAANSSIIITRNFQSVQLMQHFAAEGQNIVLCWN